ncbi:hypothetical protein chiPu_0020234 [Chiloscyllium punctatum]|uniref:Uncharacterized protein n=1 Tax=Chiloscyllium punctatum TaxID=137246 RepID=A0A401RUC4_CHIPU|nr:hypothetical protein [Chiloscyllium punctatum]
MNVERSSACVVVDPPDGQAGDNPLGSYKWFTGCKLVARRVEDGEEQAAPREGVRGEEEVEEARTAEGENSELDGGPAHGEGRSAQPGRDPLSRRASYQRAESVPSQSSKAPAALRKVKSDSAERFRRFLNSFSSRLSRKRSFQESAPEYTQQGAVGAVHSKQRLWDDEESQAVLSLPSEDEVP